MKIVFMGTPDYSVKTLESLINAGHNVAAVFAQPDKPVGRKHVLYAVLRPILLLWWHTAKFYRPKYLIYQDTAA